MNKQPSVALCAIVKGTKDEAKLLDNCLSSVESNVDSIYLNINHVKGSKVAKSVLDIANKYKANYIITEWTGNFVEARKANFAQVPKDIDFIMWLDTDDTVDKPEQIKLVAETMTKAQQAAYIMYDYDHDDAGNVTVAHRNARLVRNNGSYEWKASTFDNTVSVHETLNEVVSRPKVISDDFKVIHHSGSDRRLSSLIRNIDLLEGMFKRQTEEGKLDPRTLFYLATHYYDAGNLEGAKTLLEHYIKVSGWAEERCEALVYLGDIFYRNEQDDNAHRAYLAAIGEYQNSPRPYIGLAKLDFTKHRYEESAGWIDKCLALPKETTTMVRRPMENSFTAYLIGAQSLANIGGKSLDTALKYIKKALQLRPKDSDAIGAFKQIDMLIQNRQDIKAATRLINRFIEDKDEDKVLPFINSLPYDTQDNPMILNTRHKYTEPTKWDKKTIAIYVGQGPLGIWGPWSLETGIGGSEEAVIQLSRQLAKLGWNVTIFATPGDRAGLDIEGVVWKQFYEFNPKDEYDVLIAWRNPSFFDADIKARKKYLWLHDVMDKEEFLPERLEKIDKVIFVGKYHAELYKDVIPEDKWFISGNGINPQDFIDADGKFKRTKHRMVYMSAYNRGLKLLLSNWDKIKKAVPDATLDIYYGWEGYDAINADNPERMQWKNDLVKMINNCEGVTDHGRISHKQIVEEINKADILAYPCVFNEVYCITYVKAMAGGLNIVSTDYAELESYKLNGGTQVHYEEGKVEKLVKDYVPALIKQLKAGVDDEERQRISYNARNNYSWKFTAEGWSKEMS